MGFSAYLATACRKFKISDFKEWTFYHIEVLGPLLNVVIDKWGLPLLVLALTLSSTSASFSICLS